MKIQILSDCHLEFQKDSWQDFVSLLPVSLDTVLVIAGDLCNHSQLHEIIPEICLHFQDVIYVPGNHEFYAGSFSRVRAYRKTLKRNNFHWLDNELVEIGGQRFLGTTLWFRDSPENDLVSWKLSDFHKIQGFTREVYEENRLAREFLNKEVKEGDIVITHHLPSFSCVPARYCGDDINRFYVTEMTGLIEERSPKIWIHGHTHDSRYTHIGSTEVFCNPRGYWPGALNPSFQMELVIEV